MQEQMLFSKRDAARLLGLSVRTIENLLTRQELVARRVGRRVLIPRAALEQFVRHDRPTLPANGANNERVRDLRAEFQASPALCGREFYELTSPGEMRWKHIASNLAEIFDCPETVSG